MTQMMLWDSNASNFNQRIRRVVVSGTTYFSLVDIMQEFSDLESEPRVLWHRTKKRLKNDGFELIQSVKQLKLRSRDGKYYKTDCADGWTCMRIVQSIPSAKAEPVRQWLASLGYGEIQRQALHRSRTVMVDGVHQARQIFHETVLALADVYIQELRRLGVSDMEIAQEWLLISPLLQDQLTGGRPVLPAESND